jgi:hypothetical protein
MLWLRMLCYSLHNFVLTLLCLVRLQSQIHVKSTRGQNAKGSKITGIQAISWPPGSNRGEVKLLVTSNDSRIRVYNCKDKTLEMKFRAHENNVSQIKASFADDTGHIICGSEDRKAYIWSTTMPEGERKNQRPVELFEAHNSITTCAILAPLKTRQLLSASEDPIFDLCNPPPVTLMSRAESMNGSKPPTESGSVLPTPADSTFRRAAESPAYIARSAHTDGNIIVTADYTGSIKVFRQDCAHSKRNRLTDNWDAASILSKRAGSMVGRSNSILSLARSSRRDSTSTQPPNERIMNWRQELSHGSFDSANGGVTPRRSMARSTSPRRSKRSSVISMRPFDSPSLGPTPSLPIIANPSPPVAPLGSPKTSRERDGEHDRLSIQKTNTTTSEASSPPRGNPKEDPDRAEDEQNPGLKPLPSPAASGISVSNPLSVWNGQSWAFWTSNAQRAKAQASQTAQSRDSSNNNSLRPELQGRESVVSKLSLEYDTSVEVEGHKEEEKCTECGGSEFRSRWRGLGGHEERFLVCRTCGAVKEGSVQSRSDRVGG